MTDADTPMADDSIFIHAYHPDLPGYHPKQILCDRCILCEAWSRQPFMYLMGFGGEPTVHEKVRARIQEIANMREILDEKTNEELDRRYREGLERDEARVRRELATESNDSELVYDHLASAEVPLMTLLVEAMAVASVWDLKGICEGVEGEDEYKNDEDGGDGGDGYDGGDGGDGGDGEEGYDGDSGDEGKE